LEYLQATQLLPLPPLKESWQK